MLTMSYDAMAIPNHEFDYGSENFTATYDLGRPSGHRLLEASVSGRPLDPARTYRVATNSFLAQGGDLYETFLRAKQADSGRSLAEVVAGYFQQRAEVPPPKMGRLRPVSR